MRKDHVLKSLSCAGQHCVDACKSADSVPFDDAWVPVNVEVKQF
jgi:hypothetical protein